METTGTFNGIRDHARQTSIHYKITTDSFRWTELLNPEKRLLTTRQYTPSHYVI